MSRETGSRQQRFRAAVLKRDAYTCQQCGHFDLSGQSLQADHSHEVADGGSQWDTANGVTLCASCHKIKSSLRDSQRKKSQRKTENAPRFSKVPQAAPLASALRPPPKEAVTSSAVAVTASVDREPAEVPAWSTDVFAWGLEEPADCDVWPRISTAPHPEAVGSYGKRFCEWAERQGVTLRWWQKLAAFRVLEHRADGSLCWQTLLLSTTRQTGKSFLLRWWLLWRMSAGAGGLFGSATDPDTVLLTSTHLDVSREVWRPATLWAKPQAGWVVRNANGEQRIEHPNGTRWLVRAVSHAGYGFTLAMAVVDEAWGVESSVVDDSLSPTLITRQSPQLVIVSTAHPEATPLVPNLRKTLLAQLEAPTDALLLEWSAHPTRELDDENGWREASPIWDDKRRAFLLSKWQKSSEAGGESFAAQWLNRWRSASRLALSDERSWEALKVTGLEVPALVPVTLALETISGGGATLVTGWLDEAGTVGLKCAHRLPLVRALTMAHDIAGAHPGSRLMLGASLDRMVDRGAFPGDVELAGVRETRQATVLFQSLIAEGKLAHDGDPVLAAQVTGAAVVMTDAGTVMSGTRSPLPIEAARASLWAAWSLVTKGSSEPAIY